MTDRQKISFLLNKEWEYLVITYCGRSGSYFLHSVLDGHKDIIAFPPWCATFYSHFIDTKQNITKDALHVDSIDEVFSFEISRLTSMDQFKAKLQDREHGTSLFYDKLGANQDITYEYDLKRFKSNLHTVLSVAGDAEQYVSRKNIILAFYIAYGLTTNISLNVMMSRKALLYQLHAVDTAQLKLMHEDFPAIKHIISAKNPVQSLVSQMQHYQTSNVSRHYCNIAIQNNFFGGIIQPFMSAKNTIAVKIELLNIFGSVYMKSVLSCIGLEWDDACNESTVNGEIFWWRKVNATGVSITTGFNTHDSESVCAIKKVSCEEKILLSHLFRERSAAWGYKICPSEKRTIRGKILYRKFIFLKDLGFCEEDYSLLSSSIWDCYLEMMDADNIYAPVVPFVYARENDTTEHCELYSSEKNTPR